MPQCIWVSTRYAILNCKSSCANEARFRKLARPIPFTDEDSLARRLYKEILAEYVRGWVIFRLFVSVLLILAGAAALFSLTNSFAWTPLLGGVSGTLLGSGILVHACLMPREERDGEARKKS